MTCVICLEKLTEKNIVILECSHKYHLKCYNDLLFSSNVNGLSSHRAGKVFYG